MRTFALLRGLKILVLVGLAAGVLGGCVMSLWNWLLPGLTGWHTLSFVQALGLLVLCRILFGGFGRRGGGGGWRLRQRLDEMTPEERERFRAGLRGRFGRGGGCGREPSPPAAEV